MVEATWEAVRAARSVAGERWGRAADEWDRRAGLFFGGCWGRGGFNGFSSFRGLAWWRSRSWRSLESAGVLSKALSQARSSAAMWRASLGSSLGPSWSSM